MIELLSESLEGLSAALIAELGRYRHQVFIEKLKIMYHTRISYPDLKKK